jgi:acetyltransferase-like isoleucine patch superfamily enzyme
MYKLLALLAKYYEREKRIRMRNSLRAVGKNFSFDPNSNFVNPDKLTVGDNVFINKNVHLSGDITLGKNVMVGPNVTIFAHDHLFAVHGKSIRELDTVKIEEPVIIEDEVWIGACVVILKGVTVGIGAVVGAGVVINRSVPPYTLAVGSPVKFARRIFSDDNLLTHMKELGYSSAYAEDVLARRRKMLNGVELRVVDKDPSTVGR